MSRSIIFKISTAKVHRHLERFKELIMALPHMPTNYTTRKNIYEAAIVHKRNQENDFRQQWRDTSRYFKTSEIQTTKNDAWTSDQSFHNSMESYKSQHERETRALQLKKRKLKLQDMLDRERDQYEAELRGYSQDNYQRIADMKDRAEGLKSAREEKRKQVADDKLYEHFRKNNPDLRKLEFDQHEQHVVGQWGHQVQERQEQLESARREKEEYEAKLERDRLKALEKERELERRKIQEEKQQKSILKEQIEELKERERENEALKMQQDALMKQQWELEQLEAQRREMEEQRKKQDFGRVLLRQHKAQLRRRSKQVMEELELDRKILEALVEREKGEVELQSARREKARADAAWMKKVIEDQLRLEKAREAELDMLYQEEAARVWQKREHEWERERQAREKLMKEVLEGRQEQLEDKMDEVRQQQEESMERREELLRELEIAQQLTRREKEVEEKAKVERKEQLKAQMISRQEREESARDRLARELAEEKHAEEDYEEMLRREAAQMKIRGFQPPDHSRRQAWQ